MSQWAETAIACRTGRAAPLVRYHQADGFFAPHWPMKAMPSSISLLNQPIGRERSNP
jgi:hypothetical protein